jgi:hypothetical protein
MDGVFATLPIDVYDHPEVLAEVIKLLIRIAELEAEVEDLKELIDYNWGRYDD